MFKRNVLTSMFLVFTSIIIAQPTVNNALHFDGVNDYVSVSTRSAYDISTGTIECWVRPDNLTGNAAIIANRSASGARYSFHMSATAIGFYNGTDFSAITFNSISGTWYHLAFACRAGAIDVYVNGAFVNTIPLGLGSLSNLPVTIGGPVPGANYELFNGAIDDIRIWNRVRNAAELTNPANRFSVLTGTENGLVALFSFNQGVAGADNEGINTATDQSSTANPGALVNFALTGNTSNFIANPNILPPTITSFSPASAPTGATVTITGNGFSTTAANNSVYFGAVKATVTAATATTLTVTVPAGATYHPISVTNTESRLKGASANPFNVTHSLGDYSATTFDTRVPISIGGTLYTIAAGDLDLDGKTDLITSYTNGIRIHQNLGSNGQVTATSFSSPVLIAGMSNAEDIFTVDVNGDGKLDIVAGGLAISIYINQHTSGPLSTGSFSSEIRLGVTSGILSTSVGDINADGKPDIIVGHRYTNAQSQVVADFLIYQNQYTSGVFSAASFTNPVSVPATAQAEAASLADMNNDNMPDIVSVTVAGGLNVYINNSGSFNSPVSLAVGSNPYAITTGDFDNDGKTDLSVANLGTTNISVIRNIHTTGTYSAASLSKIDFPSGNSQPEFIQMGDINGDGKPEIVSAGRGGTVTILKNMFNGSFSAASFGSSVSMTARTYSRPGLIVDLNLDGRPEIITADYNQGSISIFRSSISLPPVVSSFSPASGPVGATVNITGSSFNTTAANNIVYFGTSRATVTAATATTLTVTVPGGATYQPVSVLNTSTGLSGYSRNGFTATFTNNCSATFGTSSFDAKVNFTTGSAPANIVLADIDGDGKLDMISSNWGSVNVSVFRNTAVSGTVSSASFATKIDLTTDNSPYGIATGDMDGDGKIDLVVANGAAGTVGVFRNTSTSGSISFAARVDFTVGTAPRGIAIGDIDGDGKLDIAVANYIANSVSILRNTSTPNSIVAGSFAAKVDLTANSGIYDVVLGDIDGDGKVDLATSNRNTNNVSIFRNISASGSITSASFEAKVDFTVNSLPNHLRIGDLDGDGKLDIAVPNSGSSNISVLRNTSTSGSITSASFAPKTDFAVNSNPEGISLGDINGDGRIDIVVPHSISSLASVLRNTSSPGNITYASRINFTGNSGSEGSAVGDVDGDGKPEIIISSSSVITSVLRNIIAPPAVASTTGGTVTSSAICDNGTWKTVYNSSESEAMVAIKDNGNNLGVVTATTYVDGDPITTGDGKRFMSRHFVISTANPPSTPVQVRLYFTDAELTALQAVDPTIQSVSNIGVTKFSGADEDGTYNTGEGTLDFIPNTSITTGRDFNANYVEFTVTSFSEFWLQGSAGALPVELASFTASRQASGVELNWSTASESNSDRFEVEKSTDGISFTAIATVNAAGNADTRRNYTALDAHPAEGLNFYRLKQVDKDGKSKYYQVVSIKWESAAKTLVTLAPQPMVNTMTVKIRASVTNGSFTIYTLTGREVRKYPVNAGSGATTIQVNRENLSSGIYLYRLSSQNGGLLESGKIILE